MAQPTQTAAAVMATGFAASALLAMQSGTEDSTVFESLVQLRVSNERGAVQPTSAQLTVEHDALSAIAGALRGNAEAHELLGLIDARRSREGDYANEAVVHLRRALELRPTSPYTWANLAAASYRVGDTGPSFRAALRHAMELGRNEPDVDLSVADYGLALWDELDGKTRGAVEDAVAQSVRFDAGAALQVAQRRGRLSVACRHVAGSTRQTDSKWLQLCESMEATS